MKRFPVWMIENFHPAPYRKIKQEGYSLEEVLNAAGNRKRKLQYAVAYVEDQGYTVGVTKTLIHFYARLKESSILSTEHAIALDLDQASKALPKQSKTLISLRMLGFSAKEISDTVGYNVSNDLNLSIWSMVQFLERNKQCSLSW